MSFGDIGLEGNEMKGRGSGMSVESADSSLGSG